MCSRFRGKGKPVAQGDHIKIDLSKCFASGECGLLAPEVFECDDDGYPKLISGGVESVETSLLLRVVESCPSDALSCSRSNT